MAVLTFPLPLANFLFLLPVEALTFAPSEAVELDETAGGEVLKADLGPSLWTGTIDLSVMTWEEAIDIEPLINILRRGNTSFIASDLRRPWPRLDPNGTILGASSVQINSLGASGRELSLKGLPPFYALSRGDRLSFTYGSRYALHELVAGVTANGSGVTDLVEVSPPIRTGAAVNAAVRLVWPICKAVLRGGASTGTSRDVITQDTSFSWVQSLR